MKRFYSTLSPPPKRESRRVVITGLGIVSPLGIGKDLVWNRLVNAHGGIQKETRIDVSQFPSRISARVPMGNGEGEFDEKRWIPSSILGSTAPFVHFAIKAAQDAIDDSGYVPRNDRQRERSGVSIGCGMGSIEDIVKVSEILQNEGYRKVTPYFIPKILPNLAAGHVSIQFGYKGPFHCASTACATGAHSIGDAFRFIQYGDADVMLAGGTEASITPLSVAGFSRAKALSCKFNETPEEASRPFDKLRDGFVIGEGSGILVLEEYSHAVSRGAHIYAEIRGYGVSGDAYHITAPDTSPHSGAFRAMRMALEQSGIQPHDVGYINAHATSTPQGDAVENRAIKLLFENHATSLCISSTKGATGHLLGAAGAVEAIFSILSIEKNVVPPTLNLKNVELPEFDLNYVPLHAQNKKLNAAVSNSFGFGGTNTSLLFTRV